jgi:hypothetical protein
MTIQEDTFTVTEQLDDLMVCCPWSTEPLAQILVHHLFLEAYNIDVNDSFTCNIDPYGGILLETIKKMESEPCCGDF